MHLSPQARMDAAFDNYLEMSALLRSDLIEMLESESQSQHWRRNYVRVVASLTEGLAHCVREMCSVSFDCVAPKISSSERRLLLEEEKVGAIDRIKLTLCVAYKLFELQPTPNFGGPEWPRAKRAFEKRNALMHPKTPADFEVADDLWVELQSGVAWLIEQLFNFSAALHKKHAG